MRAVLTVHYELLDPSGAGRLSATSSGAWPRPRSGARPRRGEPFIRALVQPSWSAYYDHVDESPGAAESSA